MQGTVNTDMQSENCQKHAGRDQKQMIMSWSIPLMLHALVHAPVAEL